MDEAKSQVLGSSGVRGNLSHCWDAFSLKSERLPASSSSSQLPPVPPYIGHASSSSSSRTDPSHLSHDLSKMPDHLPRNLGHRRAHSEILSLPDDLCFDNDLGVVGEAANGPSLSDETQEDLLSIYLDMDKFHSLGMSSLQDGEHSSATVSAGNAVTGQMSGSSIAARNASLEASLERPTVKPRMRHQHSLSMDGSTSIDHEMLMSGSEDPSPADAKKALASAELAELALIDPKRAKRYSLVSC